jgi:hypothetical protein
MSVNLNYASTASGQPSVRLNPGTSIGYPFVVIDPGESWLTVDSPAEAEAWAAAFTEAARLLREAQGGAS